MNRVRSSEFAATIWDSALLPNQKLVLLALESQNRGSFKGVFPGIKVLASKTNLEYREVCRIVRQFESAGLLVWEDSGTLENLLQESEDRPYHIDSDSVLPWHYLQGWEQP